MIVYNNLLLGLLNMGTLGSEVASWLVHSFLDQAVWVGALAGDIVLCSRARHFTVTVPLSWPYVP